MLENFSVPSQYVYLIATLSFLPVWISFFILRRDLRREMLIMSVGIGILSVLTAYYWWTVDWWHPETFTGTKVGLEDFLAGFGSGGVMAVAFEVFFRRRLNRMRIYCIQCPQQVTLMLLLAFLTSWLIWGAHLTSFWASTISMAIVVFLLFYFRRDLIVNGVISGIIMMLLSVPFYTLIILLDAGWVERTYSFEHLSGLLLVGVPIEEFVFWFLAGLLFGPYYEYWQSVRLVGSLKKA